jgi:hypothetical protein
MSLADDLAALRANGVTDALFFPDGKLRRVIMGPVQSFPWEHDEEERRGVMVLPTEVTGGDRPRGGPATAPRTSPERPKDLMRDLVLADMAPPPELDANDLPEENDGHDEPSGDPVSEAQAPDSIGEAGLPSLGPGQDQ